MPMEARCLVGLIRQIAKDLEHKLKVRIESDGLPILVTHIPLFYALPGSGEAIAFNELMNVWTVSKSSLSDLLKRYEQIDYVYREESLDDKRVVNFGLTDKGIQLKVILDAIEDDLLADLMKDLNDGEKNQLEVSLKKIG